MSLTKNIESSRRLCGVLARGLGVDLAPLLDALERAPKRERLSALECLYAALVERAKC